MSTSEVHFAQHLAANERRIRDKALARLRKWLRLRSKTQASEFTSDGMMTLWKGLFYCMWMADKPLVQEEVADNIGSLVFSFTKSSQSYAFMAAFFKTMARNHDHIDKFRIDKFLMLTRRFFRASLEFVRDHQWEHKHVQRFLNVLRENVLSTKPDSREMALGFRLHFLDIFLEELARVAEGELPQKRAHNMLEPFYEILTYCKSPTIVEGVRDKIFIELIKLNIGMLRKQQGLNGEYSTDDEDEEDIDAIVSGRDFIDDEAEEYNMPVDEEDSFDEDEGDIIEQGIRRVEAREELRNGFLAEANRGDRSDSNLGSRRRKKGEVREEEESDEDDSKLNDSTEEALVICKPIDLDMSAVKASLLEFSRVDNIRSLNRKAIEFIIKKIIDLENHVDPFAVPVDDSASDYDLNEEELKMAQKRLRVLEKQFADEAELHLIPDRTSETYGEDDDDEFEMEGGEDDREEFERIFVDHSPTEKDHNIGQSKRKGRRKARKGGGGDDMSDSESEQFREIENEIDELNCASTGKKSRKRAAIDRQEKKHSRGDKKPLESQTVNKKAGFAKKSKQRSFAKKIRIS